MIRTLGAMRQDRGGTDTKLIGQPFTLKGVGEQGFGEWTHKVRTFMLARFGDQTLSALSEIEEVVGKLYATDASNRIV